MSKGLERDLGLYATITVSIGAMVGSGIFVLPGKAAGLAGPSVVLAYLLAGVLVLPAALSKAEMATAMPEAGGTYLYIDRSMGPLYGTIAGVGAWFSLVFKSAFALVGLGSYLLLVVPLPGDLLTPVGLAVALALLAVNVVGVEQTGRLQVAVVTVVLLSLVAFVADGITYVDQARYHPFFPAGEGGLFAATGFVFVSYAGVTKIASVAEEVEDPGRNIPLGILGSILGMMVVYTLVVFVVVGVAPRDELVRTLTPMALAAGELPLLGGVGAVVTSVVAVLALTSMANAGVLSASRFPLAMSRDDLAPATLGGVHDRYSTPVAAITVTGLLLVALVAFVPVVELAKLASAFQLLVFTFVNGALVAFREADLEWYAPSFESPLYPWTQGVGVVGGLLLLTQMGPLPMAGAAFLVAGGAVWYRVYGRERTDREGAALEAIRRGSASRAASRTAAVREHGGSRDVLVPVGDPPDPADREGFLGLVRLGAAVAGDADGRVRVVRFEEVPEQLSLAAAADTDAAALEFERGSGILLDDVDVPVEYAEVVTHDSKRAVANVAREQDVDLVLGEWNPSRWRVHAELLGADVDWYMRHAGTDLAFVRNRGVDDLDTVIAVTERGPFDPVAVLLADAAAAANDAAVRFVAAVDADASEETRATADAYLAAVADTCEAPVETRVVDGPDRLDAVIAAAADADLAVVGTDAHHLFYDVLFGTTADRVADALDCTVVMTHAERSRGRTVLRALLDRFVY